MGKKKDATGKSAKQADKQTRASGAKAASAGEGNGGYRAALESLEIELNSMARWLRHTGRRLVVVIEGRDTAGKGGVIGAIADTLNPRQCHVVALPTPSERERTQWYFQRYVAHLPAGGVVGNQVGKEREKDKEQRR